MSFPEDYKTYWLDHEDDKGGWWEDNFVIEHDYKDLLEMYKELKFMYDGLCK